jgi:hypothetical protein
MVIRLDGDSIFVSFSVRLPSLLLIRFADFLGRARSLKLVEFGGLLTSKCSRVNRKADIL